MFSVLAVVRREVHQFGILLCGDRQCCGPTVMPLCVQHGSPSSFFGKDGESFIAMTS